jgi:uncharacterized membrane protein YkgB
LLPWFPAARLSGIYTGSDLIGGTEWIAALLILVGYFRPKAGIVGGMIAAGMFFTTSSMFITAPGTIATINGMRYMSQLGLFLFKDVISFGASIYLIGYFGEKAKNNEQ